jgi:prophage DNA circulation protein
MNDEKTFNLKQNEPKAFQNFHQVLEKTAYKNIESIDKFKEVVDEVKEDLQVANHELFHIDFDVHALLKEYTTALTNMDLAVDDQMRLLNLLTEIEVLVKKAIDSDDKQQVADIFKLVNNKKNMLGQEALLNFLERLFYFKSVQNNELNDESAQKFKESSKDLIKITSDIDGLINKLSKVEVIQNVLPSLQKLNTKIQDKIDTKINDIGNIINTDIDSSIHSICGQVDLILSNQYSSKYLLAQKHTFEYMMVLQKNKINV